MKTSLDAAILLGAVFSCVSAAAFEPEIGPAIIPPQLSLVSGSISTASCNTTANDNDGWENISSVKAYLYNDATADRDSPDDYNNHYTNDSCLLHGSGNELNISCSFNLQFHAEAGASWYCEIVVSDSISNASSSARTEIMELSAFSVTDIYYRNQTGGRLILGSLSNHSVMMISNLGNTELSFKIRAAGPMQCDSGSIPAASQRYSLQSGFAYDYGAILTETLSEIDGLILPKKTSTDSIVSIYWLIRMPDNGAGGSCIGSTLLEAG